MSKHRKLVGGLKFKRGRQERFDQLMSLARDGDDEAVGDLWKEFGFDFRREGASHG